MNANGMKQHQASPASQASRANRDRPGSRQPTVDTVHEVPDGDRHDGRREQHRRPGEWPAIVGKTDQEKADTACTPSHSHGDNGRWSSISRSPRPAPGRRRRPPPDRAACRRARRTPAGRTATIAIPPPRVATAWLRRSPGWSIRLPAVQRGCWCPPARPQRDPGRWRPAEGTTSPDPGIPAISDHGVVQQRLHRAIPCSSGIASGGCVRQKPAARAAITGIAHQQLVGDVLGGSCSVADGSAPSARLGSISAASPRHRGQSFSCRADTRDRRTPLPPRPAGSAPAPAVPRWCHRSFPTGSCAPGRVADAVVAARPAASAGSGR